MFMAKPTTLSDYMLRGGALNRAFVSERGEVYVVKGFRIIENNLAVADVDLIALDNPRKRIGLPLSGEYAHLYDWKATFNDIRRARLGESCINEERKRFLTAVNP
jgi:hypothetical protein